MEGNIAIGLDIGTTKIVAMIGRKNEYGKVEILGIGKSKSLGVHRGVVNNITQTIQSIQLAVQEAELASELKIQDVTVGIAGQHIRSLQHSDYITRPNSDLVIDEDDIDRLINQVHKLVMLPGEEIIHVLPQEYKVDGQAEIKEPIGMYGGRLEANFHVVVGQVSSIRNIGRCVKSAGLSLSDITLEPLASASAVLSQEEKEAGVALIDIGGGTTDLAIFKDGIIRHTAVIPFGGNAVTKDIREGCTVMMDQAEKLKVKFGSAMAEEIYDNRIITIPGFKGREHKEISEKNLSRIIQARVEEIFDYVLWEIRRSGYENKLIAGIVLTGGGSLLKHINILAEYHTGLSARVGKPVEHLAHGYSTQLASPIYATAVGLLKNTIENMNDRSFVENMGQESPETTDMDQEGKDENEEIQDVEKNKKGNRFFNKFYTLTKEFFEATPDSEF